MKKKKKGGRMLCANSNVFLLNWTSYKYYVSRQVEIDRTNKTLNSNYQIYSDDM